MEYEILSPCMFELRKNIWEVLPFKEQKESLQTKIFLLKKEGGSLEAIVLHSKKEQAHSPSPKDYFEFSWSCRFTISKCEFRVERKIDAYSFHKDTNQEVREKALQLFSPFLTDQSSGNTLLRFDFSEAIDAVIASLAKSGKSSKTFSHPQLPTNSELTVEDILHSLQRTLLSANLPRELPSINVPIPVLHTKHTKQK